MKSLLFILLLATQVASAKITPYPVHIEPTSPSAFYLAQPRFRPLDVQAPLVVDPVIQRAIELGERNLNWVKHLNSKRPASDQLNFTNPNTMTSYPVEAPSRYSPKLIDGKYQDLLAKLPAAMKAILVDKQAFTDDIPAGVAKDDFLKLCNLADRIYQSGLRWQLLQPYLSYYISNRRNDIRGYYFLVREADLTTKLKNWNQQTKADQDRLKPYLVNICQNLEGVGNLCDTKFLSFAGSGKLEDFYKYYFPAAKALHESYFKLRWQRDDITWAKNNINLAFIPFENPQNAGVLDYLKLNIEDEWKWNAWQLRMDFVPSAAAHVEFQAGVTPHVSGGDTIVMDSNAILTEWDMRWVIRHEFGHVLGFPDCYVEFFETESGEFVNYQIDVDNLMCSRRGKMNQVLYDEMKNGYLK